MVKTGAHAHKKSTRAGRMTTTKVKKVVNNILNKNTECKVLYKTIDEFITPCPGQHNVLSDITNLPRGNKSGERLGDSVRPKRIIIEGWLRPVALPSTNEQTNYQLAFFSRLALLKQQPGVRVDSNVDADPQPIGVDTTRLFLGNRGHADGMTEDYKDIIRPWNYKVVRPMSKAHDKEFFFSMQPGANNTRKFKFIVNFKDDARMDWTTTSGQYPDNGIFNLLLINRLANDDSASQSQSMELCGESRFYYYDA